MQGRRWRLAYGSESTFGGYKLNTYHRIRLGGISKSAAIVGRPTVTKPASSEDIMVAQTIVTKTMAVVPFVGACNVAGVTESVG